MMMIIATTATPLLAIDPLAAKTTITTGEAAEAQPHPSILYLQARKEDSRTRATETPGTRVLWRLLLGTK